MKLQKYKFSIVAEPNFEYPAIYTKSDVAKIAAEVCKNVPIEYFLVFALNSGNRIIGIYQLDGTTNQCAVYPDQIFRFLLLSGASGFIIAHNHPGGNTNPSDCDKNLTIKLKEVGTILSVPLIDHLIITETTSVSLRDCSWWK